MFAFLISSASCRIFWEWAANNDDYETDRDFDLKYTTPANGDNNLSTTFNDLGWRVELRYPPGNAEDNRGRHAVLGPNQGVWRNDSIPLVVSTEFDQSLGENFIRVIFNVTNTGTQSERFDLGTYADIQIGGDDMATAQPLSGLIGLTMISNNRAENSDTFGDAITLVCREHFDVTTVDYFWYGKYNDDYSQIGRNITEATPLVGVDSVFELGWLNRSIRPGETQSFNVLLAIGKQLRLPPQVVGLKESLVFETDTQCEVPVRYQAVYENVPLKLYNKMEGATDFTELDSFTTTISKNSQDYTFKFFGGHDSREKKVIFYTQDTETTAISEHYVANVIINERPTMTVDAKPQDSVYWGDKIEVPVTIKDDTKAKVVCEISGRNYEGELSPSNTKVKFTVPTDSLHANPYDLKCYAVDENGFESRDSSTFSVQVKDPPPPVFSGDPVISPNNAKAGETVTVTARVQNPLQREYKVKTVINGQTYETTVPKTEGSDWAEIKYEVKIPEDSGKTQDLNISIINSRGETVKHFDKTIPVTTREELTALEQEELRQKQLQEKKTLLWAIVGSVAGAAAIIGGVTYYFLGPAKKKGGEEEEEKTENYIDEVEMTEHIAKEVANVNNEIFPVNVENLSEGENLDFVTQDPIDL